MPTFSCFLITIFSHPGLRIPMGWQGYTTAMPIGLPVWSHVGERAWVLARLSCFSPTIGRAQRLDRGIRLGWGVAAEDGLVAFCCQLIWRVGVEDGRLAASPPFFFFLWAFFCSKPQVWCVVVAAA